MTGHFNQNSCNKRGFDRIEQNYNQQRLKTDHWFLRQALANNNIMCYTGWDNIFASREPTGCAGYFTKNYV